MDWIFESRTKFIYSSTLFLLGRAVSDGAYFASVHVFELSDDFQSIVQECLVVSANDLDREVLRKCSQKKRNITLISTKFFIKKIAREA